MDYIKKDRALLGYSQDIKEKGFMDWLRAHTSFLKPMHRYEGNLLLSEGEIIFEGKDKEEGRDFSESIGKDEITDVHLGFDDTFRRGDDRSGGLTFQPLRIKYTKNGEEKTMYVITNFSRLKRTTNNEEWYNTIIEWTG